MAKRCAFVLNKDNVVEKISFDLNWTRGFDSVAKQQYVYDSYVILKAKGFDNIADITTANKDNLEARHLSPMLMYMNDVCLEDLYHQAITEESDSFRRQVTFTWLYYLIVNADENLRRTVMKYDGFMDVFHRPNEHHCTQAKAACICKKIFLSGLDLTDINKFVTWFRENENLDT